MYLFFLTAFLFFNQDPDAGEDLGGEEELAGEGDHVVLVVLIIKNQLRHRYRK